MNEPENRVGPEWAYVLGEYIYRFFIGPLLWLCGLMAIIFACFFIALGVLEAMPYYTLVGVIAAIGIPSFVFQDELLNTAAGRIIARNFARATTGLNMFFSFFGAVLVGIISGIGALVGGLIALALLLFILGGMIGILLFGFRQLF